MACTSVNTFRPGSAPPTRPPIRTIELTNPSTPRRSTTVPTNNNPALATKFGSSKSTAIRSMACDTRLTESASLAGGEDDVKHRHRPSTGGLSRGYAGYLTQSSVDRGLGLWLTYDGPFGEEPMADVTPSLAADPEQGARPVWWRFSRPAGGQSSPVPNQ